MRREPAAFLWDVREAADRIRSFANGLDHEGFKANVLVQSAVERQFEIIGEALRQLVQASPEFASRIPDVGRIIAFRNILIHGYAVVDQSIVWRVIQEDLPTLEVAVAALLNSAPKPFPDISGHR